MEYTKKVETVFEIIAQPTVSKHLRVLREAGFVESTVDALERDLDHMDQSTSTNRKTRRRRRGPNRERDKGETK